MLRAALLLAALAAVAAIGQIHIAYTNLPGVLSVDFVSSDSKVAHAWVSLDNVTWSCAPAAATTLFAPTIGYLHQATLNFTGVARGAVAYYKLTTGANAAEELGNSSPVFAVVPLVARPEVFAVFGDLGEPGGITDDLTASAARGDFDAVVQVGDFAYSLPSENSTVGNNFMTAIQGFAATHPFMVTEGNHERCEGCPGIPGLGADSASNFTECVLRTAAARARARAHGQNPAPHPQLRPDPYSQPLHNTPPANRYRARFHSLSLHSNTGQNRFYSFDRGLAHFVVLTAEAYDAKAGPDFVENQLAFLRADLAAVDRAQTPWVVALAHKNSWMAPEAFADWSPLLQAAKVDVLFCGHAHQYVRYMPHDPVTNETDAACVSPSGDTYTNPRFMTTIVSGAAGNREGNNLFNKTGEERPPVFTGSGNVGYGLFTALNETHATWTWKTVKQFKTEPANYSDALTWVRTAGYLEK